MTNKTPLEKALAYRKNHQYKKAERLLLGLLKKESKNPETHYQLAWAYDNRGKEALAIPHYEKAIANGLSGKDLEGAIIGLGSSYRVTGQYKKSVQVLKKGLVKFPENHAMKVFLAIDKSIRKYKKAILFYTKKVG